MGEVYNCGDARAVFSNEVVVNAGIEEGVDRLRLLLLLPSVLLFTALGVENDVRRGFASATRKLLF